ncbi:MAG: sigma 54-interacting transcriptional regulator [Acidobacteria bacterium]|nr:sigma 54-interacting transcriptional regulator [Acidobacteriota bacterium]
MIPVNSLGFVSRLSGDGVSVLRWSPLWLAAQVVRANDVPEMFLPPGPGPRQTAVEEIESTAGGPLVSHLVTSGARRVLTVPVPGVASPSRLWIATTRPDPLTTEQIQTLQSLGERAAGILERPEPPEAELVRFRRLALVDELLTTLISVLDVREVFTRVSEIAGQVLPHDAISLPVIADDREHVIPFATTTAPAAAYLAPHPLPDRARRLLTEPWQFEICDDLQQDPEQDPFNAGLGYRSMLRVPIHLNGEVVALLVVVLRTPAGYGQPDVPIARRIAEHVALALSHQRLAERARHAEELRARTATLELLDELLAGLVDTGELPEVFDRVSAIARKVLAHDTLLLNVVLPDRRHARVYASSGAGTKPFPEMFEIPEAVVNDSEWEHVLTSDLPSDPVWRHQESAKRGYRAALRVAIRLDRELIGSLVFLSLAPAAYTEADLLVARRIRDRLALHLTRGRGAEAAKRADEATARAALLEARVRALTEELNTRSGYRRVVGDAPAWRKALTQATQVAATETTVLLLGESGTGKEVVARFIHRASSRPDGPFVALNCAALPEQLLEAELFGYERGAFTGATQSKPGQLEQASGGVLFLDEVGEMSLSAQAKFLRVLQEREFQRLGGTRVLKTDARIVAASNRDLHKAIDRGQFREDLYYRLNVFAIHLPPLRDRRDDVLPLSEAFIKEFGRSLGRPPAGISREARQALLDYHWPGNVRELRNVLERAAILCDGGLIAAEHLALRPSASPPASTPSAVPSAAPAARPPADAPRDLKSVERTMIVKALEEARFNKSEAAKALGLTRAQLYVRLRRHGLD